MLFVKDTKSNTLDDAELQGQEFLLLILRRWASNVGQNVPVFLQRLDVRSFTSNVPGYTALGFIEYRGLASIVGAIVRFKWTVYRGALCKDGQVHDLGEWRWSQDFAHNAGIDVMFELRLEGTDVRGTIRHATVSRANMYSEWKVDDLTDLETSENLLSMIGDQLY